MVNINFVNICAQEDIVLDELKTLGTFKILRNNWYLEVMLVLPSVNCEAPLVCLVRDAVADLGSEHHLVAIHIILHYIFQLRPKSLLVN